MRMYEKYTVADSKKIVSQLLQWLKGKNDFVLLNSNNLDKKYGTYDLLCAYGIASAFEATEKDVIKEFKQFFYKKTDWLFGFFSYDIKNEIEKLSSANEDHIHMPLLYFFQPKLLFLVKGKQLEIGFLSEYYSKSETDALFRNINEIAINDTVPDNNIIGEVISKVEKKDYLSVINSIKEHIQRGDIYEMNFCVEFYTNFSKQIDVIDLYKRLNGISPAPFSCLYKQGNKALVCSSPERFLKKTGQKLISQPIKGTIKRGKNSEEDIELAHTLTNSEKDKSENVMIVDLVRNDLSHYAKKGSVRVEELFGIYSYSQVHQMVSTVCCELDEEACIIDALMKCFPPGSMTGAPKIRAMELIENFEYTKRGLYSGAVGYFTPDRDFDFNVVIRSILVNNSENYASLMAGGAITSQSEPENEYDECLIKAQAMNKALCGET